jgi:hypothetical protein
LETTLVKRKLSCALPERESACESAEEEGKKITRRKSDFKVMFGSQLPKTRCSGAPPRHSPVGIHHCSFPESVIVIVDIERQKKHSNQLELTDLGPGSVFTKKVVFSEPKAVAQQLDYET